MAQNSQTSASGPGSSGFLPVLVKLLMGIGFLADLALIIILLGIGGKLFDGPGGTEGMMPLIIAWAIALAVSILAPIFGLRQWKRKRRDLALAGVWLPPLGLLVGALLAM